MNLESEKWQINYLRHYYNAFKGKIGLQNFTQASKSNIVDIYSTLINDEAKAQELFYDLIEKSRLYAQFIDSELLRHK